MLLVCAAAFVSGIDRTNISVAAIAMQGHLGCSETEKGTVLSAFFIGYILLMLASRRLAIRFSNGVVREGLQRVNTGAKPQIPRPSQFGSSMGRSHGLQGARLGRITADVE